MWEFRVLALDKLMDLKNVACQIIRYWKSDVLTRSIRIIICWKMVTGWKIFHRLQDHVQVWNSMLKEKISHLSPDIVEIHHMFSDLTFLIIGDLTRNQILFRAGQRTDLSPPALTVNCVYALYEIFGEHLFI